jgi:hypothetical protein
MPVMAEADFFVRKCPTQAKRRVFFEQGKKLMPFETLMSNP